MAAKLKKGDKVVVLAGKDKGKQGEITQVIQQCDKEEDTNKELHQRDNKDRGQSIFLG